MVYIKQLDAVRAISIFFVLCNHWLPTTSTLYKTSLIVSAPDIFFTISGFLITSILLKERSRAEYFNLSRKTVFIHFFLKRALRIFPAYYLTILITYLLESNFIPSYSSYLNFTANFDMYNHHYWGYLAHLWSISVEQQFYLLWPVMILYTPKKYLPYIIILFITIGTASQHFIANQEFASILPHACFDALGLGALLAWLATFNNRLLISSYPKLRLLAIISFTLVLLNLADYPVFFYHRTLVAIVTTWLIAYFILYNDTSSIFTSKPLIFIGKISYGIYLYHFTLFANSYKALYWLNGYLPLPYLVKNSPWLVLFENFTILIMLSWLSWSFFELPISNLKRHLESPKIRTAHPEM